MACQKENDGTVSQSSDLEVLKVNRLVEDFIERTQRLDRTKSDEVLVADSAEWYLEAALNYSIAEAWIFTEGHWKDSLESILSLQNNEVNYAQVILEFSRLQSEIISETNEGDHVAFVDVKSVITDHELQFTVVVVRGSPGNKALNCTFPSSGYYWWTGPMTSCGCGSNNNGLGLCADKRIQACLNGSLPPVSAGTYFTNVDEIWVSGLTNPSIYYNCVMPNCPNECVTPQLLESLTQSAWQHFQQMKPARKTMMGAYFSSPYSLCCPERYHEAVYTYGIKRTYGNSNS